MTPFHSPIAGDVLSSMITPAVLISASGTLAVSTSNRLARVVDRVRTISAEAEKTLHDSSERISQWRSVMGDQVSRLSERVMLLRGAMVCLYLAIGLLVLSSISIGILSLLDLNLSWLPVIAGLTGAASLLKASLLLVKEANMAVASTLQEIEFIRLRMNM